MKLHLPLNLLAALMTSFSGVTLGTATLAGVSGLLVTASQSYAADVAFNLDIAAGPGVVTVTAKLEDGLELVIYETTLPVGSQQSVSFTAYLQKAGQYECTVYVDGVVVRSGQIGFEYRR